MSELINAQSRRGNFRRDLLANASVIAMLGTLCTSPALAAPDDGYPTVWIEVGGQLERIDTEQTLFAPPFFGQAIPQIHDTFIDAQRPSRYDTGAEGKITFMPAGTDWIFSAAVRYGRVKNHRNLHYQTPTGLPSKPAVGGIRPALVMFGDSHAQSFETHAIIDFQVGKDVGFGLFGNSANSTINVGVRYAQFTAGADDLIRARRLFKQTYTATVYLHRNSHGIGPSASWQASIPVVGHAEAASLDFDWGVNVAALFGRQTADTTHYTVNRFHANSFSGAYTMLYQHAAANHRKHSFVMPNVGGFAALSLKFPQAKVSLGYRGDFFFNSADIGLDARDTVNQSFYGPFATVSIGLGG